MQLPKDYPELRMLPITPEFPGHARLASLPTEEVDLCFRTLADLLGLYLRLNELKFYQAVNESAAISSFLSSAVFELADSRASGFVARASWNALLKRNIILVLYRLSIPPCTLSAKLLEWQFLGALGDLYYQDPILIKLRDNLMHQKSESISSSITAAKQALMAHIASPKSSRLQRGNFLRRIISFVKLVPGAAPAFMTGSDLLDLIAPSYGSVDTSDRSILLLIVYKGLKSLLCGEYSNHATLFDLLFDLKQISEVEGPQSVSFKTLAFDLAVATPFIRDYKKFAPVHESLRARSLLQFFESLSTKQVAEYKPAISMTNTIAKPADVTGRKIGEIQALLPDVSREQASHFLQICDGDFERAVAYALEASAAGVGAYTNKEHSPSLAIPKKLDETHDSFTRRNIFDNDGFDRLAVKTSELHMGRRDALGSANELFQSSTGTSKQAIYSALASFNTDDDERDDTYDLEDVGGTIDTAQPEGEVDAEASRNSKTEQLERTLLNTYKVTPDIFQRTSTHRRSLLRRELRSKTGMTDEAIEGWAIMMQRRPERLEKLIAKSQDSAVAEQTPLPRTSWRASTVETPADSESGSDTLTRNEQRSSVPRASARGSNRGGRGHSNTIGGPGIDSSKKSRQMKEANKSRGANHSRRDQHARKMARGGIPG